MKFSTRCLVVLYGGAAVFFVLDLVTKQWALSALAEGQRLYILGSFLGLRLIKNPGAAFSLGSGNAWIFTALTLVFFAFLIYYSRQLASLPWAWTLSLIAGGALGNFADRLFRPPAFARGHVVDFIAYSDWFIGNVADIFIVLGAFGAAVLTITKVEYSGSQGVLFTESDKEVAL